MAVLDRGELERSPLADLHAIAAELGVEGFRRLRREDLVTAIVDHAPGGGGPADKADDKPAEPSEGADRRSRGGGGGRGGRRGAQAEKTGEDDERPARRRGGRGRSERPDREAPAQPSPRPDKVTEPADDEAEPETEPRTGVLDILPNGSGFLRGGTYAPDRDDVHVSPAQIRRCELRPGDEVSGPVRAPRRSERHPSLVHVETVNGAPAEPPAERPPFGELTPTYAVERLAVPDELAAVAFGKGSRVAVIAPPGAEAAAVLRPMVAKLREAHPDLAVTVALAGVRPEDAALWRSTEGTTVVVGGGADGAIDEQSQAAELALERAKRLVEGGSHAVVVVDSLAAITPDAARRIFAAARRHDGAGSLTVIGTLAATDELARLATTRIVLEPGSGPGGDKPLALSSGSGTVGADLLGT